MDQPDLDALSSRVAALAQENEALEKKLAWIARETATCSRHMASIHNRTQVSISCLPNEVLSLVFEELHRSQPLQRNWPTRNAERGDTRDQLFKRHPRVEVILSHVCHAWRRVAVALPSLWSVFWFHPDPVWVDHLISEAKRLTTYLGRSKNCDLKLFFDIVELPAAVCPPASRARYWTLVAHLLNTAVNHVSRWRSFTLHCPKQFQAEETASILLSLQHALANATAPRLERLTVVIAPSVLGGARLSKKDGGWDAGILTDASGACPSLRYLKLDRGALVSYRPPLRQITQLILECGATPLEDNPAFLMDWSVLIEDILRLPNLEDLSLSDDLLSRTSFPASGVDWKRYQILMKKLRHLRLKSRRDVRATSRSAMYFFMRYVTAPLLESMTLSGYIMGPAPPWTLTKQEWYSPRPHHLHPTQYPSLRSLTLIDFDPFAGTSRTSNYAVNALVILTNSIELLTIAYRKIGFHECNVRVMVEKRRGQTVNGRLLPIWPNLKEISFHMGGDALRRYHHDRENWLLVYNAWPEARTLRIPAECVALWLDKRYRYQKKERDVVWQNYRVGDPLEKSYRTVSSARGKIVDVVPLYDEDMCFNQHWPPGSTTSDFNTLPDELYA